ncbi:MAG: FIST signal transduction protein [Pikeienuella sp.]
MKISTSGSPLQDTPAAISNVLASLDTHNPNYVVVHMAAGHNPNDVRDAIRAKFGPDTAIHGGTSCLGVMTHNGAFIENGQGLGIAAFEDEDGDFGVGLEDMGDNPRAAASRATEKALIAAGRAGEAPELIWLTAAPGSEEAVLAGVEDVVGRRVKIVGGSAADNTIAGEWFVFDGDTMAPNGVIVSVLFPSTDSQSTYQSGYAPAGKSGVVTKVAGRRVYEIDHRPARQVYAGWTGHTVAAKTPEQAEPILADSTFAPLGRKSTAVADVPFYLLAHPATSHPDDSLELFADVDEGEELFLMVGGVDSLTSRASRVAAQAAEMAGGPVAGALVVYCGGCMLAVQDHMDQVASGINHALSGAPFLGVFTFGEQGPVLNEDNRHGNLMISCVTFNA